MSDTPRISNSNRVCNAYNECGGTLVSSWAGDPLVTDQWMTARRIQLPEPAFGAFVQYHKTQQPNQIMPNLRRIVQVFIADPSESVPLEHAVLYEGPQKLTDATDTELFFEIPIASLLAQHNEKRVAWEDKEASKRAGKQVMLEPVKIRDLRMLVVEVAKF